MTRKRMNVANPQNLGDRLTEVMAEQRINQLALAKKLNASPSFVNALVRGLKQPGAEFLVALHTALGVKLDWLLTGKGGKYAGVLDVDFVQTVLFTVQLARMVTDEDSVIALTLLQKLVPALPCTPNRVATKAETDALIETLVERNKHIGKVVTIYNRLANVPVAERDAAMKRMLRELADETRTPTILTVIDKPATPAGNPDDVLRLIAEQQADIGTTLGIINRLGEFPQTQRDAAMQQMIRDQLIANRKPSVLATLRA